MSPAASQPERPRAAEGNPSPRPSPINRPASGAPGKIGLSPKEAAEALAELRRLCAVQSDDAVPLENLVQSLREAGYREEMTQVLVDALALPEVNPHVGALWVHRLVTSRSWDRSYPRTMDDLCRRGEVGRRAVLQFLEHTGRKGRARLVRQAVRRHGEWLRAHPQGRSVAARALLNARCYRKVISWTRAWRRFEEPDVEWLDLSGLRLARGGKVQRGARSGASGAGETRRRRAYRVLNLWCATEEALAGSTDAAWAHFRKLKPAGWDEDTLSLFYLTRGVIRVQQSEKGARKEAFRAARERIDDWFRGSRMYRRDFLARRYYRRCLWRMARDSGNWGRGIWGAWRSADHWAFALPLLLVPGLQLLLPTYLYRLLSRRRARTP